MPYSLKTQSAKDIDFYFIDKNNNKLHFASAGGKLPLKIIEKYRSNREIHFLINRLPVIYDVEINPQLEEFVNLENTTLEFYLRDFIFCASRGFYSFDKTVIGDFENPYYHLVARPIHSDRYKTTSIFEKIDQILVMNLKENIEIDLTNNEKFKLNVNFE